MNKKGTIICQESSTYICEGVAETKNLTDIMEIWKVRSMTHCRWTVSIGRAGKKYGNHKANKSMLK